jgi:hypothetical protein
VRGVLVAFLATWVPARIVVLLTMTRTIPDVYLHVGGTHVHHVNSCMFSALGNRGVPAVQAAGVHPVKQGAPSTERRENARPCQRSAGAVYIRAA